MSTTAPTNFFELSADDISKKPRPFSEFRGSVVLVVNVASKCGFTPQYTGLQKLYDKYKDQGFVVLGFPCNQFLWQEPGDNNEIANFCTLNYNVSFPIFDKINVNGSNTHPVYNYLRAEKPGLVKWNFSKFLVGRDGKVIERFGSTRTPEQIEPDIVTALEAARPS